MSIISASYRGVSFAMLTMAFAANGINEVRADQTPYEFERNLTSTFSLSFVRADGTADYQLNFSDIKSRITVDDDDNNGYGVSRLFTQNTRNGTFLNNLTGNSAQLTGQFNINLNGLDTGINPETGLVPGSGELTNYAIGQKGELQNRTGYEDILRVVSPELATLLGYNDSNLAFGLTPKFRENILDRNHDGVDDVFGTIINYREFNPTTGLWSYSPDYLPFGFIAGFLPEKGFFAVDAWFMGATTYLINGITYQLRGDFHGREVPEPATMLLMGTGLVGLGAARRRKSRTA